MNWLTYTAQKCEAAHESFSIKAPTASPAMLASWCSGTTGFSRKCCGGSAEPSHRFGHIKIYQGRDSDTELSPWFRLQQEAYFRERASFQLQFVPEVTARLCRNL